MKVTKLDKRHNCYRIMKYHVEVNFKHLWGMKVTKLDKRHNCYRIMKYHVEVNFKHLWGNNNRIELFKEWREWCSQTFGPGTETKWIVTTAKPLGEDGQCQMVSTTRWAWHTEYNEMRLYFRSDAELSAFLLRWA